MGSKAAKLNSTPLWKRANLWLALIALGAVLALFLMDLGKVSPGPISQVHAQLSELEDGQRCAACHGGWSGSLTSACEDCHPAVQADREQHTGLHGWLEPGLSANCGSCHSEHHGGDFELVSAAAFAAAGVPDAERFDHGRLGYSLAGKHLELGCTQCHTQASAGLLLPGQPRYHGLSTACAACHEDAHAGALGNDCAACHSQVQAFDARQDFKHTQGFDDGGAHGGLACVECHPRGGEFSVERAFKLEGPGRAKDCAQCHDQPHSQTLLDGVARLRGGLPEHSCGECHDPRDPDFEAGSERTDLALHRAAGQPLEGAHARAQCSACHGSPVPAGLAALPIGLLAASRPGSSLIADRFPGRSLTDCASCHLDVHGGEFTLAGQENCSACHDGEHFAPATFSVADHARTQFALEGAHRALDCATCHAQSAEGNSAVPASRRLDGLPTDCAGCHQDVHQGEFESGPFAGQGCGSCHTNEAFRPAGFSSEQHAKTGFELLDGHAGVGCSACHGPPHADQPRRFQLAGQTCANCHADVHFGQFDSAPALAASGGASGCERCHRTTRFDDGARTGFDHTAFTSFALNGAHARASCESCHPQRAQIGADLRRFGLVQERFGKSHGACADCHQDAHRGKLHDAIGRPLGCAECHQEERFQGAREGFDHAAATGFGLGGAHNGLDCADCHPADDFAQGLGRQLGFALGQSCEACHNDPHLGQFESSANKSCGACHAEDGLAHFDHQRQARFALDNNHRDLACTACHQSYPLEGGGSVVRYRPLGTACGDCHTTGVPR